MLSFRLLQDVQNYIAKQKINSREMGESVLSDVKPASMECDAEAEDKDEVPEPKAFPIFPRARRDVALHKTTSNNAFGKLKDFMGVEEDESEEAPDSQMLKLCKRPEGSVMFSYSGSMADVRRDLTNRLAEKDESFSDYLIARIDEADISDAECYTRAQVSRQLFNKIKNTKDYRPSKTTAIAFGFALNLVPKVFNELLSKAGYTLSNNNDFDLIVDYCIVNNIYNIDDINELLFSFDQPLLGSR